MPVGKKPVSLSSLPMTGGVRRSFSGDEELTPPPYRTLPAQTALEAFPPPSTSREFRPSLKTGNQSQQHHRYYRGSGAGQGGGRQSMGWRDRCPLIQTLFILFLFFFKLKISIFTGSWHHFTKMSESSGKNWLLWSVCESHHFIVFRFWNYEATSNISCFGQNGCTYYIVDVYGLDLREREMLKNSSDHQT